MKKSAYNAMVSILDINETIDKLKQQNSDKTPDLVLCQATELLMDYRDVLIELMAQTNIIGGTDDNSRTKDTDNE